MIKAATLVIVVSVLSAGGLWWVLVPAKKTPGPVRRPNVIFITIDTLRADRVGAYGYDRETTPNIDKVAAGGVLFENCYSASSWTYPSIISLFTGLLPSAHGCLQIDDRLPQSVPTLAEFFNTHGYRTEAIISNPLVRSLPGFDRGFDRYDDYSVFMEAELAAPLETGDLHDVFVKMVSSERVTDRAIAVAREAAAGAEPVFLFLLYFDPHNAYVPPGEYARKFSTDYQGKWDGSDLPRHRNKPPEGADLEHLKSLYDGEVAFTDFHVGRLLDGLDQLFDPENTIIIITADHGESFAEHGLLLHGNNLHVEEVHVPMIWYWPGVLPPGKRVKATVGNINIGATLMSLVGLPTRPTDYGETLEPLLMLEADTDRLVISEMSHRESGDESFAASLTSGPTRLLMEYSDNPAQGLAASRAYDLLTDPYENKSLTRSIGDHENNLLKRYRDIWTRGRSLAAVLELDGQTLEPNVLDEAAYERLKSLGYLNLKD